MSTAIIERLRDVVGASRCISEDAALEPYVNEWRGLFRGRTPLLVRPRTTAEVAAVVALCAESGTPLVPQGGNTGLCGGAVPDSSGEQIVLSLAALDRIRSIDARGYTLTAEAGCVLADLQRAAVQADRYFPLSLAAEGSCQIGGNLSTNAGGINVLRYGTARQQVLGLEVVLPDGRIWNGLRALRKDNTGYDLKQLFIGAEGTLGVITAAVLQLHPRPRGRATAWVALRDIEAALELLAAIRERAGDALESFELMPRVGLDMVLRHVEATRDPLRSAHEWYALVEFASQLSETAVRSDLEQLLAATLEAGVVADAVVAQTVGQCQALWRLRESMSEAQKREGVSIKHDIAVPVAALPQFLREARAALQGAFADSRIVAFGHVGDGNIHFNVCQPQGAAPGPFLARWQECNRLVHDLAASLGGSFSAEHGIGQLKTAELARYKGGVELDLMRAVKYMLDPAGIMNPGKVLGPVDPVTEVRS